MAAISPLFSNYDINVFSLPVSCSFTSFFSTSLTEMLSSVKFTSSVDPIPLSVFKKSAYFIRRRYVNEEREHVRMYTQRN